MFTFSKFLRTTLSYLLMATVIGGALPTTASAAYISYPCGLGVTYRVSDVGLVTNGGSCTGTFTIHSSATTIGEYAFQNASIVNVTIPSSVTSILTGGFNSTRNLTSITIPSSVTSIGSNAFRGAISLTSINIPSGVTSIGAWALVGMTALTTITVDSDNSTFSAAGGVLFNKLQTQLLQYPMGKAGSSYVIPSSVNSIGAYAFYDTPLLTTVTIPSSLTSIGDNAFNCASGLTSMIIPSGVTSIGAFAFSFAYRLGSITIPNSVTSIGSGAFSMTMSLTSYTYCGSASLVGTGISGTPTSCSSAPGAPTIGSATATGTTTATVTFTAPASDGGSTILSYTATSSPGSITATITQAGSGTISVTGLSPSTSYTFTITALNSVGASLASTASNSITTSAALAAGIAPSFTSASSYDGRFTVQITDFDEAFTYSVTSTAGQVSINATGLVTVTGLSPDQSVTVSVTTTRTGYASGSGSITGRSQVAPMLPTNKPTVTISDTLITCTIGSYSAAPTSAAFSLFIDGKHISTNFSALGEYLPDWITPWATSSTITRTATLTSAGWALSDAYAGKAITCATLAYSKNAIGFTASARLTAR